MSVTAFGESRVPVLVGVGQYTDHINSGFEGLSPQGLAARAAESALQNTKAKTNIDIDLIAAVRTVADSVAPELSALGYPFGGPDNFPRAIAQRIGAENAKMVYSHACGDAPQVLVGEMSERIAKGELETVLLCGAEAAATSRRAQRAGATLDWQEKIGGQCQDRGAGIDDLLSSEMKAHGMALAVSVYSLFEHLRRHKSGMSISEYSAVMATLLEKYNEVGAANPFSTHPQRLSAAEICTATASNRVVGHPYTKAMVARDAVNQAAAVVLTSVSAARRMGIPESNWVYLHGYANAAEKTVHLREDLDRSLAMELTCRASLKRSGLTVDQIMHFDLYSCFPVAVFLAMDALGLSLDDKRAFTVTGGLPFFGGPGNNYSMHAIASMVDVLRHNPGDFGLVGSNGGYLSKYAVGIYSTRAPEKWQAHDSFQLQAEIDALPSPDFTSQPDGKGVVESFVVLPSAQGALAGIVGRLTANNTRFFASCFDQKIIEERMIQQDPIGTSVMTTSGDPVNHFSFI
ncbi:MAG: acetyl-CoA C-acetyltransferase [Halieaceae bacterium]|jgi:acetyl-CoA C-acetyltransferase